MPHDWIEDRRRVKRLKKLKSINKENGITIELAKRPSRGNPYQHTKTGYREDLDTVMRSSWEANFARILTIHGIKWEFEPRLFSYPIKRGTRAYCPDFYLPSTNEWVEVKGWMDERSRVKIKRFKTYYPDEFANLTIVVGRSSRKTVNVCNSLGIPTIIFYEDLKDEYMGSMQNWEGK